MMRRRQNFSKLSSQFVDYLVGSRGLSQSEIASLLSVDKSFVSRVRAGERELSPSQMDAIARQLGVPLGALLIDAQDSKGVTTEHPHQEIRDLCRALMRQADDALAAVRQEIKERQAVRR